MHIGLKNRGSESVTQGWHMIRDKAKEDLKEIYGEDYEEFHDYSYRDLEDIYVVAYLRAKADVAKSG